MPDPTCKDCQVCDYNTSITSFPLVFQGTLTQALYDSVNEPINIHFQWATRSTVPKFLSGTSTLDEGSNAVTSATTNTAVYKNTLYTLYSMQMAKATHNNWILPVSERQNNTIDIILTFQTSNPNTRYSYIVLIIPILSIVSSTSTPPSYLEAIGSSQTGSISIESCLPKDPSSLFAYYVTCLDGYTPHKTPDNAYVFVSVNGIHIPTTTIGRLTASIRDNGSPNGFQGVALPFQSRFANKTSAIKNTDFSTYILSTTQLLNKNTANLYKDLSVNHRSDPTSAYKCVQLDPEKDIQNGMINFDIDKGELLSEVLAEREKVKKEGVPVQNSSKVQIVEGVMGGIAAVFILVIIILSFAAPAAPAAPGAPLTTFQKLGPLAENLSLYGLIAATAALLGFMIGRVI